MNEVRPFPVLSLRAAADRYVQQLPAGTNGVVFAYKREDGTDRFGVSVRVGDNFTFARNLEHKPKSPLAADLSVAWTF